VFDRRHESLAILSDDPSVKDSDEEIIGGTYIQTTLHLESLMCSPFRVCLGICFRAFHEMRVSDKIPDYLTWYRVQVAPLNILMLLVVLFSCWFRLVC
jgi:hypothetical protein